MDLKEVLLKRRSVRKFTSDPITNEEIEELLHSGMSGPSACNKKPWYFVVVTNEDILDKLRDATPYTKNMNAPLAICVCGEKSKFLPFGNELYWVEDTSAATENILLTSTSLGLGSCWCGIFPNESRVEKVREILGLSDKYKPLNIIFIGHPAEFPESRDQYEEKQIKYIK